MCSLSLVGWVDNGENSDNTIGPTGVEVLLVLGPGERGATNGDSTLAVSISGIFTGAIEVLSSVSVDELSVWEIVHSNSLFGTNDKPVDLGGEEEDVDWGLGVDLIEMATLNEVPDVDLTVSSSRGNKHSVLGEVEAVDLSLVADEGVHQGHGLVVPDLDGSIPRGRNNDWLLHVVVESNAGNPVVVGLLLNGELALTIDVPDLDGLVHGAGHDLSVVWGESNGENVLGVADEGSVGGVLLQVPESECTIPRGGQAESAIGREVDVGDEVRVTLQDLSWNTPFFIVISSRGSLLDVPDDEGVVSGSGDEELLELIWSNLLFTNLHACNPSVVALKAASVAQVVLDELVFVVHLAN